jgi:acetolactate synthase I/II/III large subunit
MAKGCVDVDAQYCLFTVGLQPQDLVSCAIEVADLVITFGYDLVEYHPRLWNLDDAKHVVHLDFMSAEIDVHNHPEIEVVGDLAHTLWMLNERVDSAGGLNFDNAQQAAVRR